MATFAQTQKLKLVQPVLKPSKGVRRKKQPVPSLILKVLTLLPVEIIKHIFFGLEGEGKHRYSVFALTGLRLVCKAFLAPIDVFCKSQCTRVLYDDSVPLAKIYTTITLCVDINYNEKSTTEITYSEKQVCSNCCYRGNGLFIGSICAFKCRRFHCSNRNCDMFSTVFLVDDLRELKCYDCKKPLKLSVKGLAMKCGELDVPESDKCTNHYGELAYRACLKCREIRSREDEFYDFIYSCYSSDDDQ